MRYSTCIARAKSGTRTVLADNHFIMINDHVGISPFDDGMSPIERTRRNNQEARRYDPRTDLDLWVDKSQVVTPISKLSTEHIKNILNCINMGDELYGQRHKKDVLLAEYNRRHHDK